MGEDKDWFELTKDANGTEDSMKHVKGDVDIGSVENVYIENGEKSGEKRTPRYTENIVNSYSDLKRVYPDTEYTGNPDMAMYMLSRLSSPKGRFVRSTKGVEIKGAGVSLKYTSIHEMEGERCLSECTSFIPNVKLKTDVKGSAIVVDYWLLARQMLLNAASLVTAAIPFFLAYMLLR
ncbi:MAG: hypothetical protein GY749_02250 [Desulfobacteraceae bacterium]|nr:hypothetical protein [Desulfobacteraceae bacterium]